MFRDHTVWLVIPCRNEEKLLPETLAALPSILDHVVVIDDGSSDSTAATAERVAAKDPRIEVIRHGSNLGPGAAIISGYRRAIEGGADLVAVVGGDNQMDLGELPALLDPLVERRADYTKGNRFMFPDETFVKMPKIKLFGNMIISALTKIASGYFKIADVVDGYTAITHDALRRVRWEKAWPHYGYPMDFLVRLNAAGLHVLDVPRRPIYLPGTRQSQIKGPRYALSVSPMLLRDFLWRLFHKYMIHDFHPLIFFYAMGLTILPLGILFGLFLVYQQVAGIGVSGPRAVLCALMVLTGFQSLIFGMLFDMQASEQRGGAERIPHRPPGIS